MYIPESYFNTMELSPLSLACEEGDYVKVQDLVQSGWDIHEDDDRPLRITMNNGKNLSISSLLLLNGANFRINHYQALKQSCYSGNVETTRYMLTKMRDDGEDLSVNHSGIYFGIVNAIWGAHISIIKLILEFNIAIPRDYIFYSVIRFHKNHPKFIKELLNLGIDMRDWKFENESMMEVFQKIYTMYLPVSPRKRFLL
jgi:ankyrin repeat protein